MAYAAEAIAVLVTAPPSAAEALAQAIVDARLAACVNLLPGLTSVYRWQDQVQRDGETLLLVKTAAERFEALQAFVRERHPYELPEIVAVKLGPVSHPYLEWLLANSR